LNKECPGFSIKYGAAVSRIRRNHNGPLILHEEFKSNVNKKYLKPYLKPACHSLFKSIAENKDKICADMNLKPSDPGSSSPPKGTSDQINNSVNGLSVTDAPSNNVKNLGDYYQASGGTSSPSPTNEYGNPKYNNTSSVAPSAGLNSLAVDQRLDSMSTQGQNSCAKGVRQTLNALFGKDSGYGDSTYKEGVVSAKLYDEKVLSQWQTPDSKYKKLNSFDTGSYKNYDVRVLKPTGRCGNEAVDKHGHIEFFYNGNWYSDYKQNGSSYENDKSRSTRCYASQTTYRLSPK
jgi:hypothetical protein